MNPLVSVIIPAYNAAPFITEALESVFAQGYRQYEVIVIDDGSTDNTRDILQPYVDQGLISCFCRENSGAAAARNAGIGIATGELIAFLDADDTWYPTKLEEQVTFLLQHPQVAFVSADMSLARDKVVVADSCFKHHGYQFIASGMIYENLLRENYIFTPMVLVRKHVLEQVGIFDVELRISEDCDLWLRIARDNEIAILDRVLGVRHLHGANTTGNRELYALHQIRMYEKQYTQLENVENPPAAAIRPVIRGILADRYSDLGFLFLRSVRLPEARAAFRACLGCGGFGAIRCKMLLSLLPEFLVTWLIGCKGALDAARGGGKHV